ncbi:cytokine receptor-like factor 2 [Bombina bombina]|uniref:cytokine receptor-like factor 2 n=1 Tax=Bombina bombina TaxID=8345 RepID=UPI00235AF3FE|nr:cytokine receptor-like factor 2 [Bombina bombina]
MMPAIPDPKHIFYGLFDEHRGNFQEWIISLGNEAKLEKHECLDKECVVEELNDEEKETQLSDGDLTETHHAEKELIENGLNVPVPLVQTGSIACFANVTFTMNDSMYIMI